MKYNIGDRVKFLPDVPDFDEPMNGTVTHVYKRKFLGMDYKVRVDGDEGECEARETELESIE